MPSYDIAHIHEQGNDIIIVPLEPAFGRAPTASQNRQIAAIQSASISAELKGTVVPVWDDGGGRMGFIAPTRWHPFFKSISLSFVAANINRTLSW